MTVELRPLGVLCNLQCQYCYQNPQRDSGNLRSRYDLAKMKDEATKQGSHFSLFGGEPLMVPEDDLEDLWAFGFEKYGRNGIQTNGTLINANHIRMFKKYRVHVGISVDGPGNLNDVRWSGSLKATEVATDKTHAAIELLCKEGIPPSLIVTLHRNNATADKLPIMHDWFRHLAGIGITHARLHLLEVDHESVGAKYSLSDEENLEALQSFAELEKELPSLRLDLFNDFRNMLLGQDNNATCTWTGCDPYTTRAVRGIEGNGQSSNCGRTNKDGIDFTKASSEGFERYLALYHTPQEDGGCKDCRFFLMCKGQCPGTSIDGDWRNRSALCNVWMDLFERFEQEYLGQGIVPLSISPKLKEVEQVVLDHWTAGQQCYVNKALAIVDGRRKGSGAAVPSRSGKNGRVSGHGDHTDHGDSPHSDHLDAAHRSASRRLNIIR